MKNSASFSLMIAPALLRCHVSPCAGRRVSSFPWRALQTHPRGEYDPSPWDGWQGGDQACDSIPKIQSCFSIPCVKVLEQLLPCLFSNFLKFECVGQDV